MHQALRLVVALTCGALTYVVLRRRLAVPAGEWPCGGTALLSEMSGDAVCGAGQRLGAVAVARQAVGSGLRALVPPPTDSAAEPPEAACGLLAAGPQAPPPAQELESQPDADLLQEARAQPAGAPAAQQPDCCAPPAGTQPPAPAANPEAHGLPAAAQPSPAPPRCALCRAAPPCCAVLHGSSVHRRGVCNDCADTLECRDAPCPFCGEPMDRFVAFYEAAEE
ncbi:hypothetical protein Rsub_08825 [Raphidocelis subcapitata]|uniref:RING-type domain-containing protein n=1 Tax=Raphidocelis subcapitata TaxID=307507 RepID=A0A2V0PDN4_9CHLO|nr:hypothetical protein Rsub_08825 [Raphidocelis subcapitata]|eukprot:GBF96010.1 hypothetical protein Rsub_08825 [Raphidocelis subcapitata]